MRGFLDAAVGGALVIGIIAAALGAAIGLGGLMVGTAMLLTM